jgi:UDP-glucose 4-epimerase
MRRRRWQVELALKFWWLTHLAKRLGHITPFKQMAGLIASERAFSGSFIPVDEEIEVPPGVVAPREIIRDYIERASHRTFVYKCPCRAGEGCKNHPAEIGCILLGDAAKNVSLEVGRPATVEEALARVDEALDRGLVPMIGHMLIDTVVFGAAPYKKLVTLCFCCSCCCIFRSGMSRLVNTYPRSLVKLEGVNVTVGDDCAGCGTCVSVCPIENMTLVDGVATIGDMCLGCGACARACPRGNTRVTIEPGARLLEDLKRRVEAHADIE